MTRTMTNLFAVRPPRPKFAGALAFLAALDCGASVGLASHASEIAQIAVYGLANVRALRAGT